MKRGMDMFQALVGAYLILIISMIVCIRIVKQSSLRNRQSIIHLISVAILTAGSYAAFIVVPANYPRLATFLNGLYFIGTDWLAIVLIVFVAKYTRIHPPTRWARNGLYLFAALDSVSLIVNTFTHHLFDVRAEAMDWGNCWQLMFKPLYPIHLLFVYLMVAYCVFLLTYRLIKAPEMYKSKYGMVLLLAASVVVLNLFCILLKSKFDYSVLIYGLLAMSICYFVLFASPRRLLERMHTTLVEDSVVGLFVYDNDRQCVGVNQTAKELFPHESDIYDFAEQYLANWEEQYKGELKNVMGAERKIIRDGETKYIYVTYQRLLDEKGRVLGSGFQFEDRTEVVKQFQEEKFRATHDPLTGLLSRSAFEEAAKKLLAEANEPYCMICSNIKDFKLINELCGTDVGDALLIAEADLIREGNYENTLSARIYADKFCTLLPKRYFDEEAFKQSMASLLDRMLSIPLKTHFYLGIYDIVDVTEPIWTMSDKAMMAIDAIRGDYGQSVSYYSEGLFKRIIKEKEIIGSFDKAIADGEFHMFLQPQISNDGTVAGAEALVRWIHPEKGMISPGDFIPVLEKTGLIHELDLYMWEKAAQKLDEWKRSGKDYLYISINISTKDFYLIDVYEAFRKLLEEHEFDVKNLKLEITESALMKDVKKIMKIMDQLHELGYDIEIDDFGSGYSSLGMLKDIHADVLKIDMIFLQETVNVERSTTILKNVISMSKELGMPVITEGVETKKQVDFLQSTGCDMFQGYYFAKPMSVEKFEQVYSTQNRRA